MHFTEDNDDNDDNIFVKPNDQNDARISFGMERKLRLKPTFFHAAALVVYVVRVVLSISIIVVSSTSES